VLLPVLDHPSMVIMIFFMAVDSLLAKNKTGVPFPDTPAKIKFV
jgi:hypothetical protein